MIELIIFMSVLSFVYNIFKFEGIHYHYIRHVGIIRLADDTPAAKFFFWMAWGSLAFALLLWIGFLL